MIDAASGALAMRAAKFAYDLWRENKGDSELPLSDKAKEVLATMQTDPTDNGVFLSVRGMGTAGLPLISPFATAIRIETTERVMRELEAKGLAACRTWAWQMRAEATWHLCERRPVSLCREGRFDRNGDCILAIGR